MCIVNSLLKSSEVAADFFERQERNDRLVRKTTRNDRSTKICNKSRDPIA